MHHDSFFGTFLKSFNPMAYKNLANYPFGNVLAYFFSLLFISFIAVVVLSIPKFASYEIALNNGLDKFDELNTTFGVKASSPLVIGQNNPILIIDSTGQYKNLSETKVLLTDIALVKKPTLCYFSELACTIMGQNEEQVIPLKDFENLITFKDSIVYLIKLIVVLLVPVLLIILFLAYVLKYLAIVLLFTLIGFIVAFFAKHEIAFKEIFKVSAFASTTMIVIDIISYTFVDLTMLSFSMFMIIFVIGLITAGLKTEKEKKPF